MMRVATSQMFDRPASLMTSLTQKADQLQTSISTNTRIATASDDPNGWVQLQGLGRADADGKVYGANVKLAQGVLAQTDTTLGDAGTQLQKVQELALQASNGTLSASDRVAAGASIQSAMDELLSLANTTDVRGQPLFGGADGAAPYIKNSDGSVSYAGSGDASPIPIGDKDSVVTNVSGDKVFGDMFAALKTLSDALQSGNAVPAGTLDKLQDASDSVSAAQASAGARAARVDLVSDRLTTDKAGRDETRVALDQPDIAATVVELQKTLTILQATQASFTKLSSMSVFDYLK
jgi:flagellar hook-associated protein 3 FlgL